MYMAPYQNPGRRLWPWLVAGGIALAGAAGVAFYIRRAEAATAYNAWYHVDVDDVAFQADWKEHVGELADSGEDGSTQTGDQSWAIQWRVYKDILQITTDKEDEGWIAVWSADSRRFHQDDWTRVKTLTEAYARIERVKQQVKSSI